MAGLFKTGQELRDERLQQLTSAQVQGAGSGASSVAGGGIAQLGAALGGLLGSKLAGDTDAVGAGDVELEDADLATSKGNFTYAKRMREAGFEKEAQALEDRAMKLGAYEMKVAREEEDSRDSEGKLSKAMEPNDNQLEGIAGYWTARDDEFGEMTRDLMQEMETNPTAAFKFKNMNRQIAVNVNELQRDMEAKGYRMERTQVERAFINNLADPDIMQDEAWMPWNTEAVIDVNAMNERIAGVRKGLQAELIAQATGKRETPVETVPHQQTTDVAIQTEAAPASEITEPQDIKGKVPFEEKTTMVPITDPLPEHRKDMAFEIGQINKELKRISKDAKKVQQMIQLKKRKRMLMEQLTLMK